MKKELFIQALYNEPSILNERGYEILEFKEGNILTIRSRKDNRVLISQFNSKSVLDNPTDALNHFVNELEKDFTKLDKTIKELKGE